MLVAQNRMHGGNSIRRRGLAALLVALVIIAVFAVLVSKDGAAVAPDSNYTSVSPTAQVTWEG